MARIKNIELPGEKQTWIGLTAILSVVETVKKPVRFVGVGEKIEDLELFQPDRMASRILGMGDVLTLIEKAKGNLEISEIEKMTKKLSKDEIYFARCFRKGFSHDRFCKRRIC